jgi:hypothetical protein
MAIDGFELDVPDSPANAAAFGYPAGSREHPAFPKVRVVTIGECSSHAKIAAQIGPVGGKGSRERALARRMFTSMEEDWLLTADRGFYNWPASRSSLRPCESGPRTRRSGAACPPRP